MEKSPKILLGPNSEELIVINPGGIGLVDGCTALETTNRGRIEPLPARLTHFWLYGGQMLLPSRNTECRFLLVRYAATLEDIVYLPRRFRGKGFISSSNSMPQLKHLTMSVMWPELEAHHGWHAPALKQLVLYNDGTNPRYGFTASGPPHTAETLSAALRAAHPQLERVLLVENGGVEEEERKTATSIAELNIIEELALYSLQSSSNPCPCSSQTWRSSVLSSQSAETQRRIVRCARIT